VHRSVAGRLGGGGDNKSVYYFDVLVVSSSCFLRFLRVLEVNSSYYRTTGMIRRWYYCLYLREIQTKRLLVRQNM
jgi:hypothetical protein